MPSLSLHSPVGDLTIAEDNGEIVALEWGWGSLQEPSALLKRAKAALDTYFETGILADDLPLNPRGTPYRQRVWQALRAIPSAAPTRQIPSPSSSPVTASSAPAASAAIPAGKAWPPNLPS
jgi:methylated-DNA-[protein]-cysteine S-methyltransferase